MWIFSVMIEKKNLMSGKNINQKLRKLIRISIRLYGPQHCKIYRQTIEWNWVVSGQAATGNREIDFLSGS